MDFAAKVFIIRNESQDVAGPDIAAEIARYADKMTELARQTLRADELEDQLSYARQEIIELKAKLYDLEHKKH